MIMAPEARGMPYAMDGAVIEEDALETSDSAKDAAISTSKKQAVSMLAIRSKFLLWPPLMRSWGCI